MDAHAFMLSFRLLVRIFLLSGSTRYFVFFLSFSAFSLQDGLTMYELSAPGRMRLLIQEAAARELARLEQAEGEGEGTDEDSPLLE